jgi:tRNA-dihydrouridine synthase A
LRGLSPKQNRDVPPLDYARVYRLKQDFPELQIIINGGITNIEQVSEHLAHVEGVMLGREITRNPWLLSNLQSLIGNDHQPRTRSAVRCAYAQYMQQQLQAGGAVHALVKPLAGLYCGQPGARSWRRLLSDVAQRREGNIDDLPRLVAEYAESPVKT